ncbi:MAG: aromatic ring-hydroxylating dioxygenase subunit alpha [Propionibacterium sp.]|nr:aromatic ring-hydroxylating dioxygenase subunit alpha [Propionibacterium sp.]
MTEIDDDVRMIENPGVPDRYARGWHCLGQAKEFSDGKPHTMHAFGQKLVIWADTKGDIQVLDVYCRHMGGDLSQGEVKGDEVACPFHDWRWNGEGKCTSIPYSRRVPLRARTATWPTMVHEGILFVWNDPEGNPPIAEQMIPDIPMVGDPEWTDWYWYKFKIEGSNCRELIDNNADMAHFFYIHHSFPTYFKNVFEGHTSAQFMDGEGRGDRDPNAVLAGTPQRGGMSSQSAYYGPSFMLNPMTSFYPGFDVHSMLINSHYPIDQNSFMLNYAIMVKKTDFPDPEMAEKSAEQMALFIKMGFEQDVEIWNNKTRIDNPLLCEEDGPVYQLRRWYEQFYVDKADVTSEMTDRFEFEVDTTKANEYWRAEVEENLARKAAEDKAAGVAH